MDPERWQQVKSILHSALERDPRERAAFLDEACAANPSLRDEVASLIVSHEQASGFIESPAVEFMADSLEGDAGSLVGHSLGPYQLTDSLGGGGMGEVYRARDSRLGREVAIKVLPSAFSTDADRLRRFEQEARAASALNHPNILVIHDVGTENGSPYLVTELLQGETLRQRLDTTTIPQRKAVDYALQIARGLAAAHDRGIIHRDLKPQNLFITRDGQVKILDFGLAKLIQPANPLQTEAPTLLADADTGSGMVMGTAGYMSPEQVRGQAADQRSDIFSFGAVLYEMLTGKRAFQRESPVETMNAILKEQPAELSEASRNIPAALERVVSHCLEKKPDDRFQSTRDLVFDLESVAGSSGSNAQTAVSASVARAQSKRRLVPLLIGIALITVAGVTGYFAGRRIAEKPSPSFQRLTFRRGFIHAARFAPDGGTIIYGAALDGNPTQLFSTHPESPESRPLGLFATEVLSISSSGEMAVSVGRHVFEPYIYSGTLARVPLAGAAPREILEDVQWADWAPDGASLAIVRDVGGRNRLEFPVGKMVYETVGYISHPRISPNGDLIAFLDHPVRQDEAGSVSVVDLKGNKRTLSNGWAGERGLAWYPDGDEVWFTATKAGGSRALYAVTLSGEERLVTRMAGRLTLNDISRDGRVIMTLDNERVAINFLLAGETVERDLSWLDWSTPRDLTEDGKKLLIAESGGEGGGATYVSYLRKTDGSPAVRLTEGTAYELSPDEKWVIAAASRTPPVQLSLVPTGAGEPKSLTNDAIHHANAGWFPDGKRFLFQGVESGQRARLYVQDMEGRGPRAITPEGVSMRRNAISPDGKFIVGIDSDRKAWIYPADGGEAHLVPGLVGGDLPIRWGADGRSLYVYRREELPAKVYKIDVANGRKELWKELMPSDPAGIEYIPAILLTPDGKSYVYSYYRSLSDLYLVEGLK